MRKTSIEWTETTWNPVTGCDRVSAGCDNCYALTMSARLKSMGSLKYQNDGNPVTSGPGFAVTTHPAALNVPRTWKKPSVVFVNSMSDLFHGKVPLSFIQSVFDVMRDTPQHTYQILTKRSLRLRRLAPAIDWPANVWMGVSVESPGALHRVEHLRAVPSAVRFLSCEPLIAPLPKMDLSGMDWVIVGGESGPGHRSMDEAWVQDIHNQCIETRTPFFFKQWGGQTPKRNGRTLDGQTWDEMPGHYDALRAADGR